MIEMYYKRDGSVISFKEWIEYTKEDDLEAYRELKRVAESTVDDWWISTVYLGINHQYNPDGPPLIFETMIFPTEKAAERAETSQWSERFMDRYSTEEQALIGHDQVVTAVREGRLPEEGMRQSQRATHPMMNWIRRLVTLGRARMT